MAVAQIRGEDQDRRVGEWRRRHELSKTAVSDAAAPAEPSAVQVIYKSRGVDAPVFPGRSIAGAALAAAAACTADGVVAAPVGSHPAAHAAVYGGR